MTRREGWPRPRSKLFSVMHSRFVLSEACEHPLVLGRVVKRGAQPSAGTSLADLKNSRCSSRNGCYGISGRPFIASNNLLRAIFLRSLLTTMTASYSVFFHGGYAIHGTTEIRNIGRPGSHGCVRLRPENARTLFELIGRQGLQPAG